MTFWGIEVKPGEPFTFTSDELGGALMLTQATLGMGSSKKKTMLQVKVGGKDPIFVCSLLPGILECFTLNLEFDEEDEITFSVVGQTSIHLSGIVQREPDDDDDDSDYFGDDIAEGESEDNESETEDDSEDDLLSDDDVPGYSPSSTRKSGVVIKEIENEDKSELEKAGLKEVKTKKSKNNAKDEDKSSTKLKRKVDAVDQEPKSDAIDGDASEHSKKKKKKRNKKAKTEKEEKTNEPASIKKDGATEEKKISKAVEETKKSKDKPAKVRNFPNGFIIEEMQMGKPDGKKALKGRKVSLRYIGKLKKNDKIFDSNTGGKPFKFKLGAGHVIKGWDLGIEGMHIGEKRRLTIPPSLAYGASGSPPVIPPNAWLVFDVQLVDVA